MPADEPADIDEGTPPSKPAHPPRLRSRRPRLPAHRYVATNRSTVLGWVAASAVSDRSVYDGVVEDSVYASPDARGLGIGRQLLQALIASTEAAGIWTIQSSTFPENTASLALHHATGFRDVGIRECIGRHHGRWRDTILIERRSPAI